MAARHAEGLVRIKAIMREHQRAIYAVRLLKAALDAEHAWVAKEAADRAELLRREEILVTSRKETTNLATALAEAQKLAKDTLAAEAAQAQATSIA